jgi:hypothetical protein
MALDEKGIYLSEVNKRYPRTFQTLGYDVLMDTDSMYKPKVISTFEMCINSVLTLLFMKPGQYPSIPDLGIDIESYLHEYADDPSIPAQIKSALQDQCNRIEITGIQIDCYIDKMNDGTNVLVVELKGNDKLSYGSEGSRVIIGISYDKLNRLYARKLYG